MSAGLQVKDASGNIILSLTTDVWRYVGEVVTTAGVDGNVTDAGLSTGTPWIHVVQASVGGASLVPLVSQVGNTISWTYTGRALASAVRIVFGVR